MSLAHIPSSSEQYFKISKGQIPHQLFGKRGFPRQAGECTTGCLCHVGGHENDLTSLPFSGSCSSLPSDTGLFRKSSTFRKSLSCRWKIQGPEPNFGSLCCRTHALHDTMLAPCLILSCEWSACSLISGFFLWLKEKKESSAMKPQPPSTLTLWSNYKEFNSYLWNSVSPLLSI